MKIYTVIALFGLFTATANIMEAPAVGRKTQTTKVAPADSDTTETAKKSKKHQPQAVKKSATPAAQAGVPAAQAGAGYSAPVASTQAQAAYSSPVSTYRAATRAAAQAQTPVSTSAYRAPAAPEAPTNFAKANAMVDTLDENEMSGKVKY